MLLHKNTRNCWKSFPSSCWLERENADLQVDFIFSNLGKTYIFLPTRNAKGIKSETDTKSSFELRRRYTFKFKPLCRLVSVTYFQVSIKAGVLKTKWSEKRFLLFTIFHLFKSDNLPHRLLFNSRNVETFHFLMLFVNLTRFFRKVVWPVDVLGFTLMTCIPGSSIAESQSRGRPWQGSALPALAQCGQ